MEGRSEGMGHGLGQWKAVGEARDRCSKLTMLGRQKGQWQHSRPRRGGRRGSGSSMDHGGRGKGAGAQTWTMEGRREVAGAAS